MVRRKILVLVLLIVPFTIFFPSIGDFFYQPGALYSDLAISHYPNALFIRQALVSGSGVPLWSPSILSGYPFAADPLSGLWYPPGWLALITPLPLGFNLLTILHLLFAGVGLLVFLRASGLSLPGALAGALIFESLPKLIAHTAAGHLTLVYAVSWTPWLLLAEMKWEHSVTKGYFWKAPGIVLGIIALADVRWAALAGILWLGFRYFTGRQRKTSSILSRVFPEARWPVQLTGWRSPLISFGDTILQTGTAFLVSAPVLLPLIQYTELSTRSLMTISDNFALSLPVEKILNLFYPDIGGYAEWILYPGILTIALFFLVLVLPELRKQLRFWWITALLALIYSLGSNIPLLHYLGDVPGLSLLRVPPRALFVMGLALAIIAAFSVDKLSDNNFMNRLPPRTKPTIVFLCLTAFMVFLSAGIYIMTGSLPFGFAWGAAGMVVASMLILLRLYAKISIKVFSVWAILLFLFDCGIVNFLSIDPRSPDSVFSVGEAAASYLSKMPGIFRVYSPSYSISQQTAARYGLQLADGVDPLQLSSYVAFMAKATGVPDEGYSVTLPQFPTGDTSTDNISYIPDASLLGELNVKYVVSAFNINSQGLRIVAQFGQTRIYENDYFMPRAWVQQGGNLSAANLAEGVKILELNPNEVDLLANGPGKLVLSEVNYPGWHVWVDGREQPISAEYGLLRSVTLTGGSHQVQFIFRPVRVYVGLALSSFILLVIIVLSCVLGSITDSRRRMQR